MLRSFYLFTHRWLGLISGLVIFVVSITGCMLCFQDEIQDGLYSYRTVQAEKLPYLPPSRLKAIALKSQKGATCSYFYYFGPDRPAMVALELADKSSDYRYYNPYTGRLLHAGDPGRDFFSIIEVMHLYLLLPEAAGRLVVGISVIIFVILLITGIIIWWPKRKADYKRSFTIKWNSRWRRLNYDLHNVLGFYSASVALILAVTGLAITFEAVNRGIYIAANQGKIYAPESGIPESRPAGVILHPIDQAWLVARHGSPRAQMFYMAESTEKKGTIIINAYQKSMHFGHRDEYQFNRYNGKLLRYLPETSISQGMKLNNLNYDIHTGQVLDLPGKIIAFLVSLLCASLPVTGFIFWLGKKD